jgi:hypothetical protein
MSNNNPLFLISALSLPAFANNQLFLRKMQLFQHTVLNELELTQQIYQDFWRGYDELSIEQKTEVAKILNWAQDGVEVGERYHQTLWQAAKNSLEQGKYCDASELQQMTSEVDDVVADGEVLIDQNYRDMYHYETALGKENADRLMFAASNRQTMITARGDVIELTMDNIDDMLEQLTHAYNQARRLLCPTWVS